MQLELLPLVKNPVGEYYNIGGSYSCKIKDILDDLISLSTIKDQIKVKEIQIEPDQ